MGCRIIRIVLVGSWLVLVSSSYAEALRPILRNRRAYQHEYQAPEKTPGMQPALRCLWQYRGASPQPQMSSLCDKENETGKETPGPQETSTQTIESDGSIQE